jgi:hypothetical protein
MVSIGFVFARWKKISLASVTEIIAYLGTSWPTGEVK